MHPRGSGQIEQLFLDYINSQGLPTEPTPFDGRSDYGPFIAAGIPAGGLFTGAQGSRPTPWRRAQSAELPGGELGTATAVQPERRMMTQEQPTPLAVTSGA